MVRVDSLAVIHLSLMQPPARACKMREALPGMAGEAAGTACREALPPPLLPG